MRQKKTGAPEESRDAETDNHSQYVQLLMLTGENERLRAEVERLYRRIAQLEAVQK